MVIIFLFFIFCMLFSVSAQKMEFASPIKIPIYLSGSFAELRSDHFHSGLDIKTQGKTGIPVYAVESGSISRIVVSPGGFGKAVYIDHPNGTTSVYGHLERFLPEVEQYVKGIQYEKKSFSVDLQIPSHLFPVEKNALIGKSGNSGSSGGPHLHFEIRDTRTMEPLNPLQYDFQVADSKAPVIYSLMVAPLNGYSHVDAQTDRKTFPAEYAEGKYVLRNNPIIPVYGEIGFAVRTNDFFDGSANRCGVYSIRLYWDGELWYSFRMDRFSFSESRYINSHIDYKEYIEGNSRYHKTWIDPGNRLRIYDVVRDRGKLRVTDGNIHQVLLEVSDLAGNTSVLDFYVESKVGPVHPEPAPYDQLLKHDRDNQFRNGDVRIEFEEGTFYTDVAFTYMRSEGTDQLMADVHAVHENTVPLHKSARLSIRPRELDKRLQDKALLVRVDTLTGKISSSGGTFQKGWITGQVRSFGSYSVAVDTIPPRILPLSIRNRSAITESARIRFRISDDLSGIRDYVGTMDGKWALFEYDAKSGIISHYFDRERFELGKRHAFELKVEDYKGNVNSYEASFWK